LSSVTVEQKKAKVQCGSNGMALLFL